MAELVFGLLGAAIGGIPGIGITALTGFQIGVTLGALLFPPEGPQLDRGRVDEIRIQSAQQGAAIPRIYGRNRTAGIVIWATGLLELINVHEEGGKKGKGGGVTITDYYYSTSMAILVCEVPRSRPEWAARTAVVRREWANTEVIYDNRTGTPVIADFIDPAKARWNDGSQTLPDAAIEADQGAGNVPAFMDLAYRVHESLQLTNKTLNNAIPNFSYEIDTGAWTLQQVMNDLADEAGIPSGKRDFSELSGITVAGLLIGARVEAARAMELLSRAYWFDVIESGGILKARLRGDTAADATIPPMYIGANADGEAVAYVETTRAQEVELPRELSVSYNSEAQDFQQFTQVARRTNRWSENQEAVVFPMSLPDQYARFLADSMLLERWTARETHVFTLPYRYLIHDPGDLLIVPMESGRQALVRIVDMSAGLLAQIEVTAVTEDPLIYVDPGLSSAGIPPGFTGGVVTSGAATLFARECNAIVDSQADNANIFMAAGRTAPGWSGGVAQVDPKLKKAGGSYVQDIGTWTSSMTIGFTDNSGAGVLPVGPVGVIDRTSTVTVDLIYGSLASISEEQLLSESLNIAVIGDEVIQFQTATLVSGSTYILSNLLRGRRGTEYAINDHVPNEPFTLVDARGQVFPYEAVTHVGQTAQFRILEAARDYSSGLPVFSGAILLEGRSRKPYSPVHLRGAGDRSGGTADVTLSWVRRVRKDGDLVNLYDAPLDEPVEKYEVEIWDSTETTLLRTVTVTSATSYLYTVANQTTDGVQASAFSFRVFQMTDFGGIGRGHGSDYKQVPLYPLD